MKNVITVLALTTITVCATIVGKSDHPVTISSTPSESKFIVTNEVGKEVHSGTTPSIVTLKSSDGYFDGEKYSVKHSKGDYFIYVVASLILLIVTITFVCGFLTI